MFPNKLCRIIKPVALFYLAVSLTFFLSIQRVKVDTRAAVFYGSRAGVVTDEQNAAQALIDHMIYNFQQKLCMFQQLW